MRAQVKKYMGLALRLARKAQGETFPNPCVGAVIVKNGKVVGTGFHKKAGGPHAEIFALKKAGARARGATLFCTLEPCSHFGRTGPCADAVIKAGIKKVYCGESDPNPQTSGQGIKKLRRAGVFVRKGFFQDEIHRMNRPFFKAMTEGRPLVTIKIAQSLDGRTATRCGESKWITGPQARRHGRRLRRFFDAIMVGINTVVKDDPGLESAAGSRKHSLTKVIIDARLKIPLSARLLKTRQPVIVAAVKKDRFKEDALRKKGVSVVYTKSRKGRVDLAALLKKLARREIRSILAEGGSELIGSLLDEKLADRALVFIAPKIIGGRQALVSAGGLGARRLADAVGIVDVSLKKIDGDVLVEGDLRYKG